MKSELIFQVEESPEGGFEAFSLGESIFTDGESIEELRANIREAVECHFEPDERPSIIRLHFVRDEVFAL
jgi:predicted RNase H-like HicB family nuclease